MRASETYLGIEEDIENRKLELLVPHTVDVESFAQTIKEYLTNGDVKLNFKYSKVDLRWLGRAQQLVAISIQGSEESRQEFSDTFWKFYEDYLDANGF